MEKKKEELCLVHIASSGAWRSYPCHRKAKGYLKNGKPACGIHLRAERQHEESIAKHHEDWKESRAFTQEVKKFCEKHKIEVTPRRSSTGEQYVVVKWPTFRELVEGRCNE